MINNLYTYVATALIAGAVAATGAWKVQNWRYKANSIQQQESFAAERLAWEQKVKAADDANRKRQDDNRARADEANARHNSEVFRINSQLKGAQREINRLSDNLYSCKLMPDLVRLLNDQRASINADTGKN